MADYDPEQFWLRFRTLADKDLGRNKDEFSHALSPSSSLQFVWFRAEAR
jgi:hypothetical protein